MSSLSIRNMNWSVGMRELEMQDQFRKIFERDEINRLAQLIADQLTREEYVEWWKSTPDDNHGFYLACVEKAEQLQIKQ